MLKRKTRNRFNNWLKNYKGYKNRIKTWQLVWCKKRSKNKSHKWIYQMHQDILLQKQREN